jgi:hypothetical protein
MSITLLRTLTEKSVIPLGKNKGLQVSDVLLKSKISLIYSYFYYDRITFTSSVLDTLKIDQEDRIAKPGKNPETFKKYEQRNHYVVAKFIAQKLYDDENITRPLVKSFAKNLAKSKARAKYKGLIERERILYSKASLKAKNQNKW